MRAFRIMVALSCALFLAGCQLGGSPNSADSWRESVAAIDASSYAELNLERNRAQLVVLKQRSNRLSGANSATGKSASVRNAEQERRLFSRYGTTAQAWKRWPSLYDHREQLAAYYAANPAAKAELENMRQQINDLTRDMAITHARHLRRRPKHELTQ